MFNNDEFLFLFFPVYLTNKNIIIMTSPPPSNWLHSYKLINDLYFNAKLLRLMLLN